MAVTGGAETEYSSEYLNLPLVVTEVRVVKSLC